MEKDYFDAKFDGLEKLMASHKDNMDSHIKAVSGKADKIRLALDEHKESSDAHGLKSAGRNSSMVASWLGLAIAAAVGVMKVFEGQKQ